MSWRFLVDEDMPRSTARTLREAGYVADDARDVGLRGRTDEGQDITVEGARQGGLRAPVRTSPLAPLR